MASLLDELTIIRDRLALSLASSPSSVDFQALKADGSWSDIDYADNSPADWGAFEHCRRMAVLAKHGRSEALAALKYWLLNEYESANWWYMKIGVLRAVGESMILLGSSADCVFEKAAATLSRSRTTNDDNRHHVGANLIWLAYNQLLLGLIGLDAEEARAAIDAAYAELRIVQPGEEGIQPDFSFHQHGLLIYNGGYGLNFMNDMAALASLTQGTSYAMPPLKLQILADLALDGMRWMVHGKTFDYSVIGREIARQGKDASELASGLASLLEAQVPRHEEIALFLRHLIAGKARPPVGNRYFPCSDYMVHFGEHISASVRMHSTRTANTDYPYNGEGLRSHHLADGATFFYRTGEEYQDIFPVWDWHKVPGTTVSVSRCIDDPELVRADHGESLNVGGLSDGRCGLAAMDFLKGPLCAKKSWFFYGDCAVCLGAAIRCSDSCDVVTSVNQCLLNGPVLVDGKELSYGEHALNRVSEVQHDGLAYRFLEPVSIKAWIGSKTGRWFDIGAGSDEDVSMNVFCLWIEHGTAPVAGSYAYAIAPVEASLMLDDLKILSNTDRVQAVRFASQGLEMAAVYQPGSVRLDSADTLVDAPCLVLRNPEKTLKANL